MKCYFVLIDCRLTWPFAPTDPEVEQPAGLMGHRFVLARDDREAAKKAVAQIKTHLSKKFGWDGAVSPLMEWSVDEIQSATYFDLLKRNAGYTFYAEE
jgi:hypothetical protein